MEVIAMVITLEELHEKLGRLEREILETRQALNRLSQMHGTNPEEWFRARLTQIRDHNQQLLPLMKEVAGSFATPDQPITAEQVQELMGAEGIQPQDNLGSAGIVQMREE
jgi:hypothetical protein